MLPKILFTVLMAMAFSAGRACECPLTGLSKEEAGKYEIIFKGKVVESRACGDKYGEAIFEVEELYKGNVTPAFKLLFTCGVECAQTFNPGDEWIIYTRYKQIDNALMDWCSRSRKYFKNEKEDFYAVTYGNDYYDEVKFLRDNLGLHRLLSDNKKTGSRNNLPDKTQVMITILISIVVIVLFYWLFNRFFR